MMLISVAIGVGCLVAGAPGASLPARPCHPAPSAQVTPVAEHSSPAPHHATPPAPVAPTRHQPSAQAAPAVQGVDATINRAIAAWGKVRTLRATFRQTVTNPITGSTMHSTGDLQQRKPNKLAITFSDPAGDQIVGDGKFVWVFLKSATPGQVIKLANTDAGAASNDLIGQFLNTPRSRYDAADGGADTVGTRSARAVLLTAKPGEALPFVRAKVWVDTRDGLIRQFESTDANGVSRRVQLLTLSPNATVDDSAFTFRVPKDVRIVTR